MYMYIPLGDIIGSTLSMAFHSIFSFHVSRRVPKMSWAGGGGGGGGEGGEGVSNVIIFIIITYKSIIENCLVFEDSDTF